MEPVLLVIAALVSTGNMHAAEQASLAYMKHAKLDQQLDLYLQNATTEDQRRLAGNAAVFYRVAIEKKIVFKWEY